MSEAIPSGFKRFPSTSTCPICGTNADKPCTLMPIDDTGDDRIAEASVIHVECLREAVEQQRFMHNREHGLIYMRVEERYQEAIMSARAKAQKSDIERSE